MADKRNNTADDGGEVDLFELSRRIEQTESIHRSVDSEYDTPTHTHDTLASRADRANTANVRANAPAVSPTKLSSAGSASRAPEPTVKRAVSMPKLSAPTAQSLRSVQKYMPKRNTSAARGISINKFVKFLLIAAIVCVIIGLILFNNAVGGVNYVDIDTNWSDVKAEAAPNWALRSDPAVTNILLLGIDGDGGANQRSDTIMILTLDGKNGVIKMTSILRDTYVFIPGRQSKTRINHAYAYGGAGLTMQTVESNFRIDLERYIGIDMDGLTVVADRLGGVDIELTKAEANTINKHVKNSALTEGMQHLNGAQATYYARIRKIDSDFGRTGRQRKLIKAMLAEFKRLSVTEQYALVSETAPYLTTNYSKSELLSIGLKAVGMLDADVEEMSVPVQGSYKSQTISGMAVLVPDVDKNCRAMHQFIFGGLPE